VGGVVHHGVVVEDQVLVGGAAPHVEAVAAFAHGLYAGQGLHHLKDVVFAQGGGHLLHGLDVEPLQAHLHARHVYVFFGLDHHLAQGNYVVVHFHVELAVGVKHHLPLGVFHADALDLEFVPPLGMVREK
jgi:hypothetical protein